MACVAFLSIFFPSITPWAGGLKWPKTPHIKWDPVKDLTGKNLNQVVKDRLQNFGNQMEDFAKNPVQYTLDLPKSVLMDICSLPGQRLEGELAGQADGRWQALPPQLVAALQGQYQGVNLASVRYAENISTPLKEGMTFGNRIYFPQYLDLTQPDDLWWMLHELEHTVQYGRSDSNAETLCNYELKGIGNGFQHDRIDMEQAANRKADALIDYASAVMTSSGVAPVPAALQANQVSVSNETEGEVNFQLQGQGMIPETLTLAPHTFLIYTDTAGYSLIEFTIATDDKVVGYDLQGGTMSRIVWNNNGQAGTQAAYPGSSVLDLTW